MKKVTDKAEIQKHVHAAWEATKGLPLAPEGLAESAVFYHAGNPAPPYSPADPMDGRPGSISAAHNAILLHCAGFRVQTARIKAILANHLFSTNKGVLPGNYNPLHTADLSRVKLHSAGCFSICSTDGWQACNPAFLAACGRALPEATMETATGLHAAAEALPVASKPLKTGKAPRGANKGKGKGKPSVEDTATSADLAAGKALTE